MSDDDLRAELERLKAENERLKNQRGRSVGLKGSEKGGVSVYGLGRFRVTLYKEQWAKLLAVDCRRDLPRPGWTRELAENVVRLFSPLL